MEAFTYAEHVDPVLRYKTYNGDAGVFQELLKKIVPRHRSVLIRTGLGERTCFTNFLDAIVFFHAFNF